jgi:sporulation protein YlmC with PRC-barrel domain
MSDRRIAASRLLTVPVMDRDGGQVGLVRDVRLTADGDAWVATGLVVGRRMLAERLGYASGDIAGPWILTAWLRRRHSHLRWVPWEAVDTLDGEGVRLAVPADDLEPVMEVRG